MLLKLPKERPQAQCPRNPLGFHIQPQLRGACPQGCLSRWSFKLSPKSHCLQRKVQLGPTEKIQQRSQLQTHKPRISLQTEARFPSWGPGLRKPQVDRGDPRPRAPRKIQDTGAGRGSRQEGPIRGRAWGRDDPTPLPKAARPAIPSSGLRETRDHSWEAGRGCH